MTEVDFAIKLQTILTDNRLQKVSEKKVLSIDEWSSGLSLELFLVCNSTTYCTDGQQASKRFRKKKCS